MKTPICDFVKGYIASESARLHMPGHKGKRFLGFEEFDITEITGADSLFGAKTVIAESESNASELFGADSFYSAEGSSLSIRAAVYCFGLYAKKLGKKPVIIAARNAHKTFISAVALCDIEIEWLFPRGKSEYLACEPDLDELDSLISANADNAVAVYITSPDYLGNIADIAALSAICKKYNAPLFVDNAHGAYLKFLEPSRHPIDLGADIAIDSAHKTLPVLTGGGYLHISRGADEIFKENAKNALSLFGSTSPSYLILQSLDMANRYIANGYKKRLRDFIENIGELKSVLKERGFMLLGNEPLKLVISANSYGYYGFEIAETLEKKGIFAEFYDKNNIVFMFTPENSQSDLSRLKEALLSLDKKGAITDSPPEVARPQRALTAREAIFAQSEVVKTENALGRIVAEFNVACPPAVPIAVCGEVIDEKVVALLEYYGVTECRVVK